MNKKEFLEVIEGVVSGLEENSFDAPRETAINLICGIALKKAMEDKDGNMVLTVLEVLESESPDFFASLPEETVAKARSISAELIEAEKHLMSYTLDDSFPMSMGRTIVMLHVRNKDNAKALEVMDFMAAKDESITKQEGFEEVRSTLREVIQEDLKKKN